MPLKSRFSVDIPKVSTPSWLFTSPTEPLPDTPLVLDPVDPDVRFLTLSSYRRHAQRFAAGLRAAGFQTGDKLLYISNNSLAFYAVYMGTLMAGGIFSGGGPNMTAQQVAYQAEDVGCKFLMACSQSYETCVQALRDIDVPAKIVYLVDREPLFNGPSRQTPSGPYHDWSELLGDESQGQDFDWNIYCTDPEQLAVLNYTSGSTGTPKGVMTSHRNQIANSVQFLRMQAEHPDEAERVRQLSWVGWLPMVYVFGQTQFLLIGPKRGIRNYLMEAFNLDTMIQLIEKYRTTELFGIPSVVIGLIGGSPLKRPICERLEKLLGHPGLVTKQGWGMTEVTCIPICWHPLDDTPSIAVGELMPNSEGKIMSIDGAVELEPNQKGELYIRAPTVTQGYWKKPELTKATYLADGWLRSGDLAYYNEDGLWFVIDRLRELVLTPKGHQIIPSEVESVILDIRGVTDAGVLGIDADGTSKEPRAFVVLDPLVGLSTTDVQSILRERLDETQQMTGGVFAVDDIPKLPGAKVDRTALRKLVFTNA